MNGELRKVYSRENKYSIQSKVLNILYDQIGNGWVPHQTFLNISGWTEEEYWGAKGKKIGRMRQLLRHLRKHLGVNIIFSKAFGMKFAEEVVK